MENVEEKFLRYVQIDTPSDESNFDNTPSTECQKNLAALLCKELKAMGLNVEVTENAYVYSCIPANCETKFSIGFIAHIDTVDKPSGSGVKPMVHKSYSGGDICLSTGKISPEKFPVLNTLAGQDIITSDGTTVLGADDKAGVAEIMSLAEYLVSHPEVKHGKIGIAFTPDEEIGHGAKLFDVEKFGCDFAYTVDGEELGEITYETFNGACFDLKISGVNIHPGAAKGKMINAVCVANVFINALPAAERPETTEGREGYYFITEIEGGVENCTVHGIIRDHDRQKFEERKAFIYGAVDALNKRYGGRVKLTMRDQYYNCAEVILPHKHLIENAVSAMLAVGVAPIVCPIRGGTDGSSLSFMGLPCPNICTGGHNAHGLNEFVSVQHMQKVVEILKGIVAAYARS
ncbi:MAG: peptidase T [Muribaculaceae bacterium]|nr:peptidase T [Muribaculaceae bacterium]